MFVCTLMISKGTHGLILYKKNLVPSISMKVYVNVYNVRREKKWIGFLEFTMIVEENLRTQAFKKFVH